MAGRGDYRVYPVTVSAKTIEEYVETIPTEQTAPKSLIDLVMFSVRVPRDVMIRLEVAAEAAGKSRLKFASELMEVAIRQLWNSDKFDDPKYYDAFKERCINSGIMLDEFMTEEEQYELFAEEERQRLIAEQKKQEGGQEDVQA